MIDLIEKRDQLFGRSLTILVVDVISAADEPVTNYTIRDNLLDRMTPQLRALHDPQETFRLYTRILLVTNALVIDGLLVRDEKLGTNKHVTYYFDLPCKT